jgi:FKBP-type peptidyl-prolyl cis-trans isomerase FkpA
MNVRIAFALLALVVLSACNQVTGQKDRGKLVLKTTEDSVAYGIGTDVGLRLRGQLVEAMLKDSLNSDMLTRGIRDGLDSIVPDENVIKALQQYQIAMQKRYVEMQRLEAEKAIKAGEDWMVENGKRPGVTTTASGLQYEVVTQGNGPRAAIKDTVVVNYRGTFTNGTEFDGNIPNGPPVRFSLTQVIPGWTEVLQLMPAGSKWKVYVPSHLGYGAEGNGPRIPPHSVLLFDMEVLEVKKVK